MKKLIFTVCIFLMVFSCIRVNQPAATQLNTPAENVKDGLFIHVKQGPENAHEVLMALSMALKFAKDSDVLMYFDIDGISMLTKNAPDLQMEPFGSSDVLFSKLVNMGVHIFACPGCMEVYGVSASELRSGVTIADKDEFFNFTDGRILSIDY